MIIITIVFLSLLFTGAALMVFASGHWNREWAMAAGGMTTIASALCLLVCVLVLLHWFGAEAKAKLINREFGTHYTTSEVFWAASVIDEIRQIQRNRVEINGHIMNTNQSDQ